MNDKPEPAKLRPDAAQAPAQREEVEPGNAFVELVHELAKEGRAIAAVRSGLSDEVLRDAGKYFGVPLTRMSVIVHAAGVSRPVLDKRRAPMDASKSDGLWRLVEITAMAEQVFDDAEAARTWLRSTNRTFHNSAPIDYLDTERRATAVRQVLNAIASGGVL